MREGKREHPTKGTDGNREITELTAKKKEVKKVNRLFHKVLIGTSIGIAVILAISFSPPLVFGEGHVEYPMELVDRLAERAERGELTLGETFEALGKPLCMVPIGFWDRKVSMEDVRNIVLYFHGTPQSLSAEEMDALWAHLAERAERGELTVRELFQAFGEPLCPTVPIEVWDSKVSTMGPPRRIKLQRVETSERITNDRPSGGTVQPAFLFWMGGWSSINRFSPTIILHTSGTITSRPVVELKAISELRGPKGNTAYNTELLSSFVIAWDLVFSLPFGVYFTYGTHSYWDPLVWPASGTIHTATGPLVLPGP